MESRCESCGQALPHRPDKRHPTNADGTNLGSNWIGATQREPSSGATTSVNPADIEEAQRERETVAATPPPEPVLEAPEIAEVQGDYGAADAAPGFPDSALVEPDAPIDDGRAEPVIDASNLGARSTDSVQVGRLQRQLARREAPTIVAYQSAFGIVVIDLARPRSAVSIHSSAGQVSPADPGDHILRTGAQSFAIDPDSLQVTLAGVGSRLVVSDARDGNTYTVEGKSLAGQAATIQVRGDSGESTHRLPAGGMHLQPVDGLGLLAVPKGPVGETLIAVSDSFERLSPNRVLTGNATAVLEQICVDDSLCSLVITNLASGAQQPVPAEFARFGDQYLLSPDGQLLLRYSPVGFAELFVAGSNSTAWVTGAGMVEPAWGPNSDFIVWFDQIDDAELKVMFPDERDWLTIKLADLGVPPPTSLELIAFPSRG